MNRALRTIGCVIGILSAGAVSVARGDYCTFESIPHSPDEVRSFDVFGKCTHVATEGRVGPFAIGISKVEVLGLLEKSNVSTLTLLPKVEEPLRGFDRRALEVLSDAPGVNVWAHKEPLPLKLEFTGEHVALLNPSLKYFPVELQRLAARLQPKTTRSQFFDLLAAEPAESRLTVAAVVPRGDYVSLPFKDSASRQLSLAQSKWRFDGFKAICPFQPFYSTFKVVFADDRLVRIEHFCFPYELP
jgi:hypothetical protein